MLGFDPGIPVGYMDGWQDQELTDTYFLKGAFAYHRDKLQLGKVDPVVISEVLDILSRDPRTARFIARKLAVRFVSDAPPATLVDRAARTFLQTDGDIREVVRTIVTSPEFFGRGA